MKYQQPAVFHQTNSGFTLIEMIGVLAIIAILAASVAPRVFDVIADSRGTRMVTEVRSMETAVARYYGDVGTLQDLAVATGLPALDAAGLTFFQTLTSRVPLDAPPGTNGAWARFNGPYLEKFTANAPAVGAIQNISVQDAEAAATAATATNFAFDLDGINATNDTPGDGPEVVVVLQVQGVDQQDFNKVDSIFDDSVPGNPALNGRVKYDFAGATPVMMILVAYR